eukprot:XP_001702691.1 predicted protein [Chlamydomonas reinhardtii]
MRRRARAQRAGRAVPLVEDCASAPSFLGNSSLGNLILLHWFASAGQTFAEPPGLRIYLHTQCVP